MGTLAPGVARWQGHVLMTSPPSIFTSGGAWMYMGVDWA